MVPAMLEIISKYAGYTYMCVSQDQGDAGKKGDFIFLVPRVIELITKTKRVTQDIQRASFTVNISNQ